MATEKQKFERDLESAGKILDVRDFPQAAIERTKLFVDAFKHMATLTGAILAFVLTSIDKLSARGPAWLLGFSLLFLFLTLLLAVASLAQVLSSDALKYSLHQWQLRGLYFSFAADLLFLALYTTLSLFFPSLHFTTAHTSLSAYNGIAKETPVPPGLTWLVTRHPTLRLDE